MQGGKWKKMKKKEKQMIGILIAITVIVILIAIGMNYKQEEKKLEIETKNQGNVVENQEKNVELLEDGTRLNTSNKLKETKKINGMEISNFQLTEKDNVTLLLGTVTNTSNTKQGGYPVNVKIIDEQGNEIITVGAYLGELEPGESTQFNTSATFDWVNAYDFSVSEK